MVGIWVTSTSSGSTFSYDANGNQIQRVVNGQTYTLAYDGENNLSGVSGAATATFVYDGDGQRVKATVGGTTTAYLGSYFEWTGSTSTMVKYFYASGRRVAMKKGSTVYFLLSDHLGSTTLTTTSSGAYSAELRYKAWGETRYTSGTTQTQRRYTGQIEESALGLYYFNARWYDAVLGRFAQADSIVPEPGNPQAWDRYAYTFNNPIRFTDPFGYAPCFEDGYCVIGTYSLSDHLSYLQRQYGIIFTGLWKIDRQWEIMAGVQSVGDNYSITLGSTSALAFRDVHGIRGTRRFIFEMGCPTCFDAYARTLGSRHVQFGTFYSETLKNITLAVHELFHAFEGAISEGNNSTKYKLPRDMLPNEYWTNRKGLASPHKGWQQSEELTRGEVFADMGIGWAFNVWDLSNKDSVIVNLAQDRSAWMNANMPIYIMYAIYNQRVKYD